MGRSLLTALWTKVKNTILANNIGGNCSGSGIITSLGHSLSSDITCSTEFKAAGDLNNKNPLLSPLADNGGPTQTHALLAGSPASDRGGNTDCPTTDQRGYIRPVDGNGDGTKMCDIGAYEYKAKPAPPPPLCTTKPGAPILVAPTDKSIASQPALLDWSDVKCAKRYEVVVKKGSISGIILAHLTQLTNSQFTFATPKGTVTYYWHVRACNQFGCSA